MAVLIVSPLHSFSQYFQKLYDIDSAQEWGWNISVKTDSDYFILGSSYNQYTNKNSLYSVVINKNTLNKVEFSEQNPMNPAINIGSGGPGEATQLQYSNEYIYPLSIQWPNPVTHFANSAGGITKLDAAGNVIFMKTYTDTSVFFDAMLACAITQNNQAYLIGGARGYDTPSNYYPAHLMKTDTSGDTLWTRNYQYGTQIATITSIITLTDGRIVIYATSAYQANPGTANEYTHNSPWFLLLDSMGNVLRDTMYSTGYVSGNIGIYGDMYADKNGGYIVIGGSDSIYTTDLGDAQNFPGYIAHLDTNFRMTWRTSFPYSEEMGHRQGAVVRQLKDSSYLIIGDSWQNSGYDKGFAAKISRTGSIIWSHNYYSDEIHDAYLRDGVEKPDGSIVMTGKTFNDTLPAWHQFDDMWLVGVDSNGCEDGLCAPAAVPAVVKNNELLVYPNPTNSVLNFEFPASGNVTIKLMDIAGRVLDRQEIANDTTASFNVKGYTAGLYLYQFITAGNTQSGKFIVQ